MKKYLSLVLSFLGLLILVGCSDLNNNNNNNNGNDDLNYLFIDDYQLAVDEEAMIVINTSYSDYSDINFEIENDSNNIIIYKTNYLYALRGNTTTKVTASLNDKTCEFSVTVIGSKLDESKYTGTLFNEVEIESNNKVTDDFIVGADISSIAEVLKNGGKFYNSEGYPESAFLQLKNNGFNYVRIRVWNDPTGVDGRKYGGGNNDLDTAIKIGSIAKQLGFKILLCLHYSDFWADPAKQVMPKDWAELTTSDEVAAALKQFTFDVLDELDKAGAKADMVQIGNEITNGMLRHTVDDYNSLKDESKYKSVSNEVSGAISVSLSNFKKYLNAGISGAKESNPNIKIMIHMDRGGNTSACQTFFDRLTDINYDIIGISYYSFYHGSITNFGNNITNLENRFNKQIIVAETSYAFTEEKNANNSSIFQGATNNKGWAITPTGQASKLKDITSRLLDLPRNNGIGWFYWEPAWLPVKGAGWAEAGTNGTWADQALFSYDGVALPSLSAIKTLTNR